MKLSGIFGKGSGKVGSSVFAVSGGEQIVREYNPKVSNPQTDAQVAQRARFKLLSQVAGALSEALAFTKKGLVSARNQFIQKNIGRVSYTYPEAEGRLEELDLTGGSEFIPELNASMGESNTLNVALISAAPEKIDAVVYVVAESTDDEKLIVTNKSVVTEAGTGRLFPTSFANANSNCIVYAYGIIAESGSSKTTFEDYTAQAGYDTMALSVVQTLMKMGAKATITRAQTIHG